jgi:hypothetical protein
LQKNATLAGIELACSHWKKVGKSIECKLYGPLLEIEWIFDYP